MLTRLQAQRHANNMDESDPAHDLLSRFSSFNQGNNSQDYYGQSGTESPLSGLDDFPPPAPTPPTNFGHSHHTTAPMGLGPIGTMPGNPASKVDQSTNLLNLLKFSGHNAQNSQPPAHTSPPAHSQAPTFDVSSNLPHTGNPPPIHAPVPMPADPQGLLATLMKGNAQNESSRAEAQAMMQSKWNAGPPPVDTQAYLLNLLHRPKPAQNDQPFASQAPTLSPQSANGSSVDHSKEYTPLKHVIPNTISNDTTPMPFKFGNQEHVASPPAKFEYNSPMSQLSQHGGSHHSAKFDYAGQSEINTTSPHNVVSKSSTPGTAATGSQMPTELPAATMFGIAKKTPSAASSPGLIHDHKRLGSQRSPVASPEHSRRKLDGSPYSKTEQKPAPVETSNRTPDEEKETETVSEAITGLAEQADKEAREALERAENEEVRAKISDDLEFMMKAKTDAEFQDLAEAAAKDIQAELEKEENAHVLEDTFPPEVAQSIRGVIDDVAQGAVADSWESAEADEIVVIEETPNPVRVYNFPMKPWISITMQETKEPRPQFRDEVILDIARLKKDFDQIDRNLVAATESYMVYGMSKAGGLRVIRQDDGKDAKLFTDTKDRIFNVAMSSAHSDLGTTLQESIIGTGISGTVYYIQIKNGGKDHLEDAHPEQYGFALPPIMISQDGGDSGGVLKTRARTSSTHPEFFAVGRGKVISIIWPSWIMQNNVFKPGHDRVVDTERLYRECFLRISTGKAGKDFTFSQDDTTIVSLDKSGRVKFWDVRNLIAAEDPEAQFPLPAHTSVEVKEPLMTLNTTPEGEKAWPTSVLLLDKQRPYQKGWALRYMIVGMKQNHTLQLWDLALGKPVQEFNLPHTKESDPVCSIMYHPPTGMIVVGHPMRNSIYFLHLSAPKYTIKNLSQVEYIQKLVAKDPSIPEPDSTAVISGIREYSFDNKGILRSVDMLSSPATSADADEQPLFELYAMHSKGVTGVVIKQGELGWSKDNKIINGVDAAEAGLVKIAKLKELPSAVVSEPQPLEEHISVPLRIRSAKETPPPQLASLPSTQDQPQKSNESLTTAGQSERKEAVGPSTPANQSDKTEKKARKKREKVAAAERLAAENAQSNGNTQSSRVDPVPAKHVESKPSASSIQSAMSQESIQSTVKQIVTALGEKLTGVIASEFKDHREKVDIEFNHRDDKFVKSQHVLLDKVSNVLNANVQAVLTKTISDQFEVDVVPALSTLITKVISDQIDNKVSGRVSHSIQNQMQKLLPNAVNQALQKPELSKAISDKVAGSVALEMEKSMRQTLVTTITPIINDTVHTASHSVVREVQERTAEQIAELEQQHLIDSNKIDQLITLVSRLSDTVTSMSATQSQLQDGLLKLQQQTSRERVSAAPSQQTATHHSHAQSLQTQSYAYESPTANSSNQLVPFPPSNTSARDAELQHMIAGVAAFMERGDYEAGVVRWIQQDRTQEVFDEYIVKLNPQFLHELRTLVSLSVASAIVEQLEGPLLRERVNWVETVLHILHSSLPHTVSHPSPSANDSSQRDYEQDPQLRDVVPNVMSRFLDRFQKLYMRISSQSPGDPLLSRLSSMTNIAIQLKDVLSRSSY
ncbi:hypothetical protein Hte_004265 [Hypoxylon texense]